MTSRRRVVVVGGGIAGLTMAAALDPERFEVVVHEAEPGRAALGVALALFPGAQRVLRRLGALDEVRRTGGLIDGGSLHDITGRRLLEASGGSMLMASRPALIAALGAAVPESVRVVHSQVSDPASLDADLVIGADGVRSAVRGLVWPAAAQRVQTPWIAMRGRHGAEPARGEVGEYWGPGLLFGIVPLRDPGTYWFSTHASDLGPEPLDVGEVLDEARARFATAAPAAQALLRSADPATTLASRLWVTPPLPRYVHGRYVVIGDAAHAMTPNLGRGGCEAIVDAASLAGVLNRGAPLLGWQARRVPWTQAARAASTMMMRQALTTRWQRPRDAVLAGMGRLVSRGRAA